ncbi:hypothetical protein F1331_25145 [Salmonella enterica subsp. enterica serovar Dessau]|uniref:Uncharacterized protein n=1 Tax=Salmonella enterica subsp. enterica serovar Dessau TaxID=2564349 RepID=A0A8E5IN00_SALET|nr:hypothetical protein F1331_25145 [Salmonella enterica subsp. enterica serovar Dessau]
MLINLLINKLQIFIEGSPLTDEFRHRKGITLMHTPRTNARCTPRSSEASPRAGCSNSGPSRRA